MCDFRQSCFKSMPSFKICFVIVIFNSTSWFIIWLLVQRQNLQSLRGIHYHVVDAANIEVYRKDLFYILLTAHSDWAPFYYFTVKDVFHKNNCSYNNCVVTDNWNYFGGDLSKFHAFSFNGRILDDTVLNIPRWPHQKFIYYNTESPANVPISSKYDGFFNWTSTFRLDSDIPYPYLLIKDSSGNVVGPKSDMKWKKDMTVVDESISLRLLKKTKAAVAFVSNCNSKSGRENLMNEIRYRLEARGYNLDIYGKCGTKECSRKDPHCDDLCGEYYFYLAFENSLSKDYVTEKVLRALRHDTVPVVYGGADYSRFLPPGSYINARSYSPYKLAALMVDLINSPGRYRQFFSWRQHYSYHDPMAKENVCALCEALNNRTKYQTVSIYQDMQTWWNIN